MKVWSPVAPGRAFARRVGEVEAPRQMVWRGGMPLGLFTGRRTLCLSPAGAGTELSMRETFSGPLAPMNVRKMPDLSAAFAQLLGAVKREVEGG
ncbi:MAG: SRPBCC family protein [Pseudomonadota bacterium]